MKEIAEALKGLFDKISDFFDIFDLSFFVSGAVTVSALFFWATLAEKPFPASLQGGLKVLAIGLLCYVNGLICFTVGRCFRTVWRWFLTGFRRKKRRVVFDKRFQQILEDHGLAFKEPFKGYIDRNNEYSDRNDDRCESRPVGRLYIRLWAELRQSPDLTPSLALLKRYWVMAATYDGMAVALMIWALVIGAWCLGIGPQSKLAPAAGIGLIIILVLISIACSREAGRYAQYQREELAATMAVYFTNDTSGQVQKNSDEPQGGA